MLIQSHDFRHIWFSVATANVRLKSKRTFVHKNTIVTLS